MAVIRKENNMLLRLVKKGNNDLTNAIIGWTLMNIVRWQFTACQMPRDFMAL